MSLKNFHVFFISLATMLCLFVGAWSFQGYRDGGGGGMLVFAGACFAAALGLVVYGTWFLKKMRDMKGIDS